jgi:hypothetical protein
LTSGEVTQSGYGVIEVAARRAAADFHRPTGSRRNRFRRNLVKLGNYDIADKIREQALQGAATAKRVGSSWASTRRATT